MNHLKSAVQTTVRRSGRIWSGPAQGLRLEGPTSFRVFAGLYELEVNKWIRRFVGRDLRAFDLGAQYGLDALMFAKLGAPAVLTVESDPAMKSIIQRNVDRNELTEAVQLKIATVGDGRDSSVTIDELAAEYFTPDFVKMDIEGAEEKALIGASATLKSCQAWLIETHSLAAENACIAAFASKSFQIDTISPRRIFPDRRLLAHNRWIVAQLR